MPKFMRFSEINEYHLKTKPSAQDAINDAKVEAMKTLKTVFNKHGASFWLDCGTALGVVRENDLLKNDSDWDVGMHAKHLSPALIKDLKETFNVDREGGSIDDFYTIGLISKNEEGKNLTVEGRKIWGDVNVYYPIEDRYVYSLRLGGKGPYYYLPKEIVNKGTKSVKLRGGSFNIFKEIKSALDLMFKNWKTPSSSNTYPNTCTSWIKKATNLKYNRSSNSCTCNWPDDFDPMEKTEG